MRIAILHTPSFHTENTALKAVADVGLLPEEVTWKQWESIPQEEIAGYILLDSEANDASVTKLKEEALLGKPILGVADGAKVLIDSGLVPGAFGLRPAIKIEKSQQAHEEMVHIQVSNDFQYNAFTRHLTRQTILQLPLSPGDNCFVIPSGLMQLIEVQGLNIFQYCDASGQVSPDPGLCSQNIAALANQAGNVMAMLPHPERTINGEVIFHSMRDYIKHGRVDSNAQLDYFPRK